MLTEEERDFLRSCITAYIGIIGDRIIRADSEGIARETENLYTDVLEVCRIVRNSTLTEALQISVN